jgi:hypothetical protein
MQKMGKDVEDAQALAKKHEEDETTSTSFLQLSTQGPIENIAPEILSKMSPTELAAFKKFQENPVSIDQLMRDMQKGNYSMLIPEGTLEENKKDLKMYGLTAKQFNSVLASGNF